MKRERFQRKSARQPYVSRVTFLAFGLRMLADFFRSPLVGQQVLYRYPNRAKPCFPRRLCPEELNRLVHVPPATHKMVRHRMAEKLLTDWVWLDMRRKRRLTRSQHLAG